MPGHRLVATLTIIRFDHFFQQGYLARAFSGELSPREPGAVRMATRHPVQKRSINERAFELYSCGQSFWYDNIRRSLLKDGTIAAMIEEDGLRGMTSNPSIFEKAIGGGEDYDEQIRELASSGLEVEAIYEQLVVTDIAMPYCNGYELARAIKSREEWKHIPVMAVTSLSGEEDRQKGLQAGINEYQIKLERDEVLQALELLILRTRSKADIPVSIMRCTLAAHCCHLSVIVYIIMKRFIAF